jgi:hypothetical protein
MKTQELIAALAADDRRPFRGMQWQVAAGVVLGAVIAAALFIAVLGMRTDFGDALTTWRFDLKLVVMAIALAVAAHSCVGAARPEPRSFRLWGILLFVAVAATIATELVVTPRNLWRDQLVGTNAVVCLASIPALAVAPLLVLIFAMRAGAPSSPAWAGAMAGALSAAIAAAMYALHCFDDSPLFVAVWYSLAALPVVATGAIAGHRLLRW